METFHIGQMIEKRRKEIGMSKVEFARKLGTSRQNGFMITQRKSIQTELLQRIGAVLGYDFFSLFTNAPAQITAGYEGKIKKSEEQLSEKDRQIQLLEKDKAELLNENTVIKKLLLENK